MFDYDYSCSENYIIDFESPGYNAANADMQVISEFGGTTNRDKSQMENVLDSYIKSKAVPLVLRKRLMYQRSLLY